MATDKKKTINYVVTTRGRLGEKVTECETEDEAWEALDDRSFGALKYVSSPTGKSVIQFVPF